MLPVLENAIPSGSATNTDDLVSLAVLAIFLFLMFTLMIVFAIVSNRHDGESNDD